MSVWQVRGEQFLRNKRLTGAWIRVNRRDREFMVEAKDFDEAVRKARAESRAELNPRAPMVAVLEIKNVNARTYRKNARITVLP